MTVARSPHELEQRPRTVAIGTFDGVHLGHRAVLAAAAAGPSPTVVTFDPHPRGVLGGDVSLLATLERRLELFAEVGIEDVLVVEFTRETAALTAEQFARDHLLAIGAEAVAAGAVGDRRAAVSIGVNPHYGGKERRIEAFLLDWSGDLYGRRLVVELWERLRDERAFASEAELVEQIARDVAETRAAVRPA